MGSEGVCVCVCMCVLRALSGPIRREPENTRATSLRRDLLRTAGVCPIYRRTSRRSLYPTFQRRERREETLLPRKGTNDVVSPAWRVVQSLREIGGRSGRICSFLPLRKNRRFFVSFYFVVVFTTEITQTDNSLCLSPFIFILFYFFFFFCSQS